MTSEGRIMPNHQIRKCACGASVKLNAKYCLKHGEEIRGIRGRLSMIKNNREIWIEKYENLYNFLNRTNLKYGEGLAEVKNRCRTKN